MKRLKTGSMRRAMFVGIMSVIFILSLCKSVYAGETGQGTISVALKDLSKLEGSVSTYNNVEFSLYRVGTTGEDGKSAMNAEYGISKFPESADEYEAAAKQLKDKVKDSAMVEKKATDANGKLLFSGLADGVYLLVATSASNYGIVQPALVHLPYYDDMKASVTFGEMVRETEVEPKAETVKPTNPGGDTGDSTDPGTTKPGGTTNNTTNNNTTNNNTTNNNTTNNNTTNNNTTNNNTTNNNTTNNNTTNNITNNNIQNTGSDSTNKPNDNDGGNTLGPNTTGKDTTNSGSTNTYTSTGSGTTGNKVTSTTTSNKTNSGSTSYSTGTGSTGTATKSTATASTSRVKTGDETPIAVYLAMAGLSLLVLGMVIKTRRERDSQIETKDV